MYAYTTGALGTLQDTITYTYGNTGWKDQLTNYDGTTISYDASGNPTNWIGNLNTLTWSGRQLSSISMPNNQNINFKYNSDGIRTYKYFIDNDEMYLYQHDYMLEGSTIVGEKVTYNSYYEGMWTKYKYYHYDENGSPIGMNYEGKDYYFQKNILGDIEAIYQGSTKVVQYVYDAWGNVLSVTGSLASTIGQENPFRYRGYYYDTETGLYYLQSRYYDPQVGRFLNADEPVLVGISGTVLSCNLYAYCENNCVNRFDETGHLSITVRRIIYDYYDITIHLSDKDIRMIKFGITSFVILFDLLCTVIGGLGGIPSKGISVAGATIAGGVVTAIGGLSLAYIDYNDYGKGAKIVTVIRIGLKTTYCPIIKRFWGGWYTSGLKKIYTPYAYIVRLPKLIWNR